MRYRGIFIIIMIWPNNFKTLNWKPRVLLYHLSLWDDRYYDFISHKFGHDLTMERERHMTQ